MPSLPPPPCPQSLPQYAWFLSHLPTISSLLHWLTCSRSRTPAVEVGCCHLWPPIGHAAIWIITTVELCSAAIAQWIGLSLQCHYQVAGDSGSKPRAEPLSILAVMTEDVSTGWMVFPPFLLAYMGNVCDSEGMRKKRDYCCQISQAGVFRSPFFCWQAGFVPKDPEFLQSVFGENQLTN